MYMTSPGQLQKDVKTYEENKEDEAKKRREWLSPEAQKIPQTVAPQQKRLGGFLDSVRGDRGYSAASAMGGDTNQMQLANLQRLNRIASGQEAGAGELAVGRMAGRAIADQQAMAAAQRGGNAALAARGAARNVADIGTNAAGQSREAAMADQMQASNMLTQGIQGRAQLEQNTNLANMDAELKARGMDDAARIAYLSQMTGLTQAELQARISLAGIQSQYDLGRRELDKTPGVGARMLGGILQAGGAFAMKKGLG